MELFRDEPHVSRHCYKHQFAYGWAKQMIWLINFIYKIDTATASLNQICNITKNNDILFFCMFSLIIIKILVFTHFFIQMKHIFTFTPLCMIFFQNQCQGYLCIQVSKLFFVAQFRAPRCHVYNKNKQRSYHNLAGEKNENGRRKIWETIKFVVWKFWKEW